MARSATPDAVLSTEDVISRIFSHADVGLCVVDDQFRYLTLNRRLALIHGNGVSAESYVGKTLREMLGRGALQAEQACQQVLATGKPLLNFNFHEELAPKRTRYWTANLFPVKDANGRVTQVCVVVVVPRIPDGRQPTQTPQTLKRSATVMERDCRICWSLCSERCNVGNDCTDSLFKD